VSPRIPLNASLRTLLRFTLTSPHWSVWGSSRWLLMLQNNRVKLQQFSHLKTHNYWCFYSLFSCTFFFILVILLILLSLFFFCYMTSFNLSLLLFQLLHLCILVHLSFLSSKCDLLKDLLALTLSSHLIAECTVFVIISVSWCQLTLFQHFCIDFTLSSFCTVWFCLNYLFECKCENLLEMYKFNII